MFNIKNITRKNVLAMKPYSSARNEFDGMADVSLDANENPFGFGLNRYPDPSLSKLKSAYAKFRQVNTNQLIFGNGSDELIDLLIRAFCEPGQDKILTFSPSFSMYAVCAQINNVAELQQPLNDEFQLDLQQVEQVIHDENLKLIFICSPNNPTGNKLNQQDILSIAKNFSGLVVVDEAYVDFSDETLVGSNVPNVFILQTFSKALGLAGARLGVGIGSDDVIAVLNKIKPPYNINTLTQNQAVEALERPEEVKKQVSTLIEERTKLENALLKIAVSPKSVPFGC